MNDIAPIAHAATRPSWHAGNAALFSGPTSPGALLRAIDEARASVFVIEFVMDVRHAEDRFGEVRDLLKALARAVSRGVDVRVLLPRVELERHMRIDLNEPAARFLCARGVPVRRYDGRPPRPILHAKLVTVDDEVCFVGNENWTPSAFRLNTEELVRIQSKGLTLDARARFENLWITRGQRCCGSRDPAALAPPLPPPPVIVNSPERQHSVAVRFLNGQPYVRVVERSIREAAQRVWLAMFGLRASTAPRLRPLIRALRDAAAQGVDVRVLYDGDQDRRDLWADVPHLLDAGIPCRPWPFQSRLHTRAVLVDHAELIAGSVGWTPQSVFLCEELSVQLRGVGPVDSFAERFESWWELATREPRDWDVDVLGLDPAHVSMLVRARARTLGHLLALEHVPGIEPMALQELQRKARWVVHHRMPLSAATLLARAGVASVADLQKLGRPAQIDARLRPRAAGAVREHAPVGSFLRRWMQSTSKRTHRFVRTTRLLEHPRGAPRIIPILPPTTYDFSSIAGDVTLTPIPILQNLRTHRLAGAVMRLRVHSVTMQTNSELRVDARLAAPSRSDPASSFVGPIVGTAVMTAANAAAPVLLESTLSEVGSALSFFLVPTSGKAGTFTFTISADLVVTPALGGFSPLQLGEQLTLWVDRHDQVLVSGHVSTWGDQSTAQNDFSQSTSSFRPAAGQEINQQDAPDFDGTDDYLAAGLLSSFVSASAYHVFAVIEADSVTGTNATSYLNNGVIADTGAGWWGLYLKSVSGSPRVLGFHWGGGEKVATATGLVLGQPALVEWSYDGATIRCQVGTEAEASVAAASIGSVSNIVRLGTGPSGSLFLDGRIAAIIVCKTHLSESERRAVRDYLSAKYGVAS